MPSKKASALEKVQDLYLMQVELWNFLDDEKIDAEQRKNIERTLREFKQLLREVDWHYMGGEDVLQTLTWIPQEVSLKLRHAPRRSPTKVATRVEAKKGK